MDNVIIANPKKLKEKIGKLKKGGADKLHILSDFDMTLTKAFVDGEKVPSIISILRDGNYLTKDYAKKAHELFDKYHPIEIDLNIPLEERKRAMLEWWTRHFDLLIKSGLNKKDIEEAVKSEKIKLRRGVLGFIDLLNKFNVPLIILSSAGLGKESISMIIQREERIYENIHIISNSYKWDENGNAVGINEPIITVMNKSEIVVKGRRFGCRILLQIQLELLWLFLLICFLCRACVI